MNRSWKRYKVSDLEEQGLLFVEDGNHGQYRPRPDEFGIGDTAFIRASDMVNGIVAFDSAERINDVALERIRKGIGRGGDVILSSKGTVGKLAFVPLDAPPFVCSPQTTFWRTLDSDRLDRRYLFYFMSSSVFQDQWKARKGETDMADYISLTAQREFVLTIPDIQEQRAIARILGGLDDKIELNRRMNCTLEAMVRSLFRSWFVDFDPVVSRLEGKKLSEMDERIANLFPAKLVESQIGLVPQGWSVKSISDLASFVNGRNFTKNATGTGKMVIRIADLNSGVGGSTVFNDVEADPVNTAYPDDILFSWSGSLDVYRWHGDESLVNQHIFKVVCSTYPKWFVYCHLREAMPFYQDIASGKATTMGHIKRSHLSEVLVSTPGDALLTSASRIISPLYDRIHLNERESSNLVRLRDILLSELISDELNAKEMNRVVGLNA